MIEVIGKHERIVPEEGAILRVVSDKIDPSRNETFRQEAGWGETVSGLVSVSWPLQVSFTGAGEFQLESPWTFDATSGYCFRVRFSETGTYGPSASEVVSLRVDGGPSDYAVASIRRVDGGPDLLEIQVIDQTANPTLYTATTPVIIDGGFLYIQASDDTLYAIYEDKNGKRTSLQRIYDAPTGASLFVRSSEDDAVTRSVKIWSLESFPVFSNIDVVRWHEFIVPQRTDGAGVIYRINPEVLATYQPHLVGNGQYTGQLDQEVGTIEVGEFDVVSQRPFFMVSPIERLYGEGGGKYACPVQGDPVGDVRGDIIVSNRCFDDGSSLDNSGLTVKTKLGGRHLQDADLRRYPQFELVDDQGRVYGHNYDWTRIDQPDGGMGVDTAKAMLLCRTLEYNDGANRIHYGLVSDPLTVSQDVFIQITPTYSYQQGLTPGAVVDTFRFSISRADGTAIYSSGVLDKPTVDADPSLLTYSGSLEPGRYVLGVTAFGEPTTYETGTYNVTEQGLIVRGVAYDGTTSADPEIARITAEPIRTLDTPVIRDRWSICSAHFNIDVRRANIVAFVMDPSTGAMTRYAAPVGVFAETKTDSIACIRVDDGFVFFFQDAPNPDSIDNRSKALAYVKLSDAGVWGSKGAFRLPLFDDFAGDPWVHAFDAVRDGDKVSFFLSLANDLEDVSRLFLNENGVYESRSVKVPSTPFGEESVYLYRIDISPYSFDGSDYRVTPRGNPPSYVTGNQLKGLFTPVPQVYFRQVDGAERPEKFLFFDSIRANYDRGRGLVVLSLIDLSSRTGVILMGQDRVFKEVAIPFHFQLYDTIIDSAYSVIFWSGLDSLDACLSPDGSLVSVASRGSVFELGFSDPSIFWENNDFLVKTSLSLNGDWQLLFFPTRYRFKAVTFQGQGIEYGDSVRSRASICSSFQYMIASTQLMTSHHSPCVWLNGAADRLPFEVPDEQVWVPELANDHDSYSQQGVLSPYDIEIKQQAFVPHFVSGSLEPTTTYRYKYDDLDVGYRFHARLKAEETTYTYPLEFYAKPYYQTRETGPTTFEGLAAEVRWNIDGDVATAEVYDASSGSWLVLGEIPNFNGKIWDLYILVRALDGDTQRFEAAFVAKLFKDIQQVESQAHSYEHVNEEFYFFKRPVTIGDDVWATPQTFFTVSYRSNPNVTIDESARVYLLGYATLKGDEGVYSEQTFSKNGNTEVRYTPRELPGEDYRLFDDTRAFDSREDEPLHSFRAFKLDENYKTQEIHWYNGFAFSFAGSSAYTGDSWVLSRSLVNDLQSLMSKRLHGFWASASEGEDVFIWADAFDSGFDKFVADIFLVKGVNTAEVQVVAKDDIADPWSVIGDIDLSRHEVDAVAYEETGLVNLYRQDLRLYPGRFSEHAHYYKTDAVDSPMASVVDAHDDHVSVELADADSGYVWTADAGRFYSSRGYLRLDTPIQYRYIGFKFPQQKTFHGWFQVECVDFGAVRGLPAGQYAAVPSGEAYTVDSDVFYAVDNQPVTVSRGEVVPSFSFVFNTAEADTHLRILSLLDNVSMTSRPIWVFQDGFRSRDSFELTLVDGEVTHEVVSDTSFERRGDSRGVYSISLELRSVGE